ncbi:related to hexose transporter protein [Rhynchosporium agropyri]|uniref:Related to hexose transporter protein n=1 Tax=Rhynchosporium agropyri TaxID=914238 RepID=A0A1E1KZL5_9HELO|nr:related to hexose transporter protein [Rhynchosporium agropyri]
MENHIPFDLASLQPWYERPERVLLYCGLLPAALLTPTANGFDTSMTNALQTIPAFQEHFDSPTGSSLGFFGAAQSIGGIVSIFLGTFLSDKFGRRCPLAVGSVVIIGSTFGQVWAVNFGMFCAFKVIIGIGIGLIQLGAAPLVAELVHPKERVAITNLFNTSIYIGVIVGAWVSYGTYTIDSDWAWKIPCILQIVCSVYQSDKAKALLTKYHGAGDPNNALVDWEFAEMVEAITLELSAQLSWKELLQNKGMLWRAFICVCCGVFSQTSGNGLISAYLTTILHGAGIRDAKSVTLINGGISIWSWIIGVACAVLTSKFRRRPLFLYGTSAMLAIFIGWTIAQARYDISGVPAAGYAVIALVFLYNAAYAFCWLYLPIGLENIGWKCYVYYDVWIAIEIVIIYFFFPETSGRTLEEIAVIFDGESAALSAGMDEKVSAGVETTHAEKQ